MKKNKYDVIVIGAGSGGLNVASFFARIQMSVLLVDKNEESLGGDCLNTGCVPSKALIHIASLCKASRSSHKYGLTSQSEVDIALIMNEIKRKQGIIRAHENSIALEEKGIDVILGKALFTGRNSVSVNGESFVFKKCVLATGSRARMLDIQNDMSVRMFSNETIFDIDYLPKQFVFIGGGPISCELGQAFARLGSHVTILNTQDRILPRELAATSETLSTSFHNDGITIINNVTITKIQDKKLFYTTDNDETLRELSTDAIFFGIGRVLNIEGLDLENALVETDEKKTKVLVNEYLQTTNPAIYTVGDVAGSFMFTHTLQRNMQK